MQYSKQYSILNCRVWSNSKIQFLPAAVFEVLYRFFANSNLKFVFVLFFTSFMAFFVKSIPQKKFVQRKINFRDWQIRVRVSTIRFTVHYIQYIRHALYYTLNQNKICVDTAITYSDLIVHTSKNRKLLNFIN